MIYIQEMIGIIGCEIILHLPVLGAPVEIRNSLILISNTKHFLPNMIFCYRYSKLYVDIYIHPQIALMPARGCTRLIISSYMLLVIDVALRNPGVTLLW